MKTEFLDAMLGHVVFDGWSETSFAAAIRDTEMSQEQARELFPRRALDAAIAFHKRGDAQMAARMKREDLMALKYSERVAAAVRYRLEAAEPHKEEVRRGTALFALPQNAAQGARLVWGTADAIWDALEDRSEDYNWYTKRATLSAVYSSTVLFWLGDSSEDHVATWEFLDRRIENVLQFETFKSQVRRAPFASTLLAGPSWLLSYVRKPVTMPDPDLPGYFSAARDPD
ncbi:MAG: COQ9 family protein [Pseudomonadota bacterium]